METGLWRGWKERTSGADVEVDPGRSLSHLEAILEPGVRAGMRPLDRRPWALRREPRGQGSRTNLPSQKASARGFGSNLCLFGSPWLFFFFLFWPP